MAGREGILPSPARPQPHAKENTMTQVSAEQIKNLPETTGAGMLDCRKALTENGGDMEAAIDWLRKKGLSAAAKKSGRIAAEGLVGVASAPHMAAMVEV